MYIDDSDELPKPQRYRVVTVTNIWAGRAKDPKHGEPVALVSLTHEGTAERPLMFRLKDVRKLALGLMAVLTHHTNECPIEIINSYFYDPSEDGSSTSPPDDLKATPAPPVPPQKDQTLRPAVSVELRFSDPTVRPVRLQVLGGHRHGRRTLLLMRCNDLGGIFVTGEIGRRKLITFHAQLTEESAAGYLADPRVRVGNVTWPKLTPKELKTVVKNKVYTYAAYQRLPKPGKESWKTVNRGSKKSP